MRAQLIKFVLALSARLPLRLTHLLGSGLGKLLLHSDNQQRRVARINLQRCFPELDASQQERLLRENLSEIGKSLFESGHIWGVDKERFLGLVTEVHGAQHLQQALAKGKGAILAIPHLGNWEVVGLHCSSRHPMTSLYRPPRVEEIDQFVRQSRERFGAKLVPTNAKGVRALYQALADNELVAILPDQDPRDKGGQFAPFFGIQANTMTLLSRLAHKSQATVLCSYAERLPNSRGFAIHFLPAPAEFYADDMETSVTALNQLMEQAIRRIPAQYQWGYKRFRTRPEGEKDFYDEV
jgi:KDO2-lipid IV(A) lauroyltransferase